jgi:predicted outer membrane protein
MKSKITIISQFCVLPLIIAALSVAGVAVAQDAPASKSSSLSVKDKTFMKKAAKGGMMEVAMGNLAEQMARATM